MIKIALNIQRNSLKSYYMIEKKSLSVHLSIKNSMLSLTLVKMFVEFEALI